MIELYTWPTPNGHKVHIALEELGLPYEVKPVDITAGEQFDAEYLKLNPNNKMPTIVDREGCDVGHGDRSEPYPVFESGAILMYLADKAGSELLPQHDAQARYRVLQWLFFQMAHVGPMLGQAHHFRNYTEEEHDYGRWRYTSEAARLYRVLDGRLADRDYLAGDYSIADIATFPWIRPYESQGQDLDEHPNLKRWFETIRERPAVQRGLQVLSDVKRDPRSDDRAHDVLFGSGQFRSR